MSNNKSKSIHSSHHSKQHPDLSLPLKLSPLASAIAFGMAAAPMGVQAATDACDFSAGDGICRLEVTSTAMSGEGSLAEALQTAESEGAGIALDTVITFNSSLSGQTISLSSYYAGIGLYDDSVTVNGGNQDITLGVESEGSYSGWTGFDVWGYNHALKIRNLDMSVSNPNKYSGVTGIRMEGDSPRLVLDNVDITVSANAPYNLAEAVSINGEGSYSNPSVLKLSSVTVSGDAEGGGNMLGVSANFNGESETTITDSSFAGLGNSYGEAAAVGLHLSGGYVYHDVSLTGSTFSNNGAYSFYGPIAARGPITPVFYEAEGSAGVVGVTLSGVVGPRIKLDDVTFHANSGQKYGSGLTVKPRSLGSTAYSMMDISIANTTFSNGVGTPVLIDGRAYGETMTMVDISNTTFSENEGLSAGAVSLLTESEGGYGSTQLDLTLRNSTITGNGGVTAGVNVSSAGNTYAYVGLKNVDITNNYGYYFGGLGVQVSANNTYTPYYYYGTVVNRQADMLTVVQDSSITNNYADGEGSAISMIAIADGRGGGTYYSSAYNPETYTNYYGNTEAEGFAASTDVKLLVRNTTISGNEGEGAAVDLSSSANSDSAFLLDTSSFSYSDELIPGVVSMGAIFDRVNISNNINREYGSWGGGIKAVQYSYSPVPGASNEHSLFITNSTISGNSAKWAAAATLTTYANGEGSGDSSANLNVVHSTISGNKAGEGEGYSVLELSGNVGELNVRNAIVAGNPRKVFDYSEGLISQAGDIYLGSGVMAADVTIENSVIGEVENYGEGSLNLGAAAKGNVLTNFPGLENFGKHGGDTFAFCLQKGSPAIDLGSTTTVEEGNAFFDDVAAELSGAVFSSLTLNKDQSGQSRLADGKPDAGAMELQNCANSEPEPEPEPQPGPSKKDDDGTLKKLFGSMSAPFSILLLAAVPFYRRRRK